MDKKKSFAAMIGVAFGLGVATRVVDLALIGGALATAAGAVGFAGYMALTNTHTPNINGMRYLAIFAQPSHHLPDVADAGAATLDMTPVGAIPRPQKTVAAGYALVGASESHAWLREGDRIFAVRLGDEVPGLGRVARIALIDGRWTLADAGGATLLISAQPSLAPSGDGRFNKRMIFGAAP